MKLEVAGHSGASQKPADEGCSVNVWLIYEVVVISRDRSYIQKKYGKSSSYHHWYDMASYEHLF